MLEQITRLIEATEGLEIQFKMGKESELTIKGDFLAIAKLAAKLADKQDRVSDLKRDKDALERKISEEEERRN